MKLRYDLYYVKYMSIALDLGLLWSAVRDVLFGNPQLPTSIIDAMVAVWASR